MLIVNDNPPRRGASNLREDPELLRGVLASEYEREHVVYPEGSEQEVRRTPPPERCEHGVWRSDTDDCRECLRLLPWDVADAGGNIERRGNAVL